MLGTGTANSGVVCMYRGRFLAVYSQRRSKQPEAVEILLRSSITLSPSLPLPLRSPCTNIDPSGHRFSLCSQSTTYSATLTHHLSLFLLPLTLSLSRARTHIHTRSPPLSPPNILMVDWIVVRKDSMNYGRNSSVGETSMSSGKSVW